jgi:voltage-gated potassium channel
MKTPLARIRAGAIVLLAVFFVAVIGYRIAGRGWLDAIYMVVITVSTVGYGETSSLSPVQKVLTMGVILVGISAAVFSLGGFIQMMMEGEIDRALSLGRTARAIERLDGHVVLCGFGRIGRILAKELAAKGQSFVIVDHATEAATEAQNLGYLVRMGDATEEEVLRSVRVERAKTLVTALPSDAANVFITLTSRDLNRSLQIIARGELPSTEKKLLQAGANRVVLPAAIGAMRMAAIITRPSAIELLELVAGRSVLDVEVDEIAVAARSPLVGRTIGDSQARRLGGLLIVAVKQKAGAMVFNPGAEVVFQPDDTLIVMGRVEDIDRFRRDYNT